MGAGSAGSAAEHSGRRSQSWTMFRARERRAAVRKRPRRACATSARARCGHRQRREGFSARLAGLVRSAGARQRPCGIRAARVAVRRCFRTLCAGVGRARAAAASRDDAGAKLLADALTQLRKRQYALALQHPEKIRRALEAAVAQGRDAGEGYWTLLLELLQWQNDRKSFEDRAADFAVAFELSPPSWEPPPSATAVNTAVDAPAAAAETTEMLCWQGTMTGPTDPQLAKFAEFREGRSTVPVDMSTVDRIDFVCAGALLNAIIRAEGQRKTVQIAGATPIIRALLLLIGISPRHFIKKPQ